VRALPFRLTARLISVLVPTGVSSGSVTLQARQSTGFVTLQQITTVGPQITGYYVPQPPRVQGVLEASALQGMIPSALIVYGLNMDTSVFSAKIELMSINRQTSELLPDVQILSQDRGISVPNVSDPAIKGVRISLPKSLGQKINRDDAVYYLRVSVRAGTPTASASSINP